MNEPVEVNVSDMLEVVKSQRNAWADEASVLAAQCMTLGRRVAELEKKLAELQPAKEAAA